MFKMRPLFFSVLVILALIPLVPDILSDPPNQPLGDFVIPTWVKSTAGWWSDDKIPDSSFIETIEFLIKDEMITVEIPDLDSEVSNEIPTWVKSTAGWWSDDKIHDVTFIASIKYLMSQGIIHVEREQVEESEKCTFKGFEVVCSSEKHTEEIKEFDIVVNSHSCTPCTSWTYVGKEYHFQIETFDGFRGNPIDDVIITAKIISKDGELRYDFGTISTEDGIYLNSITIPNMDWYADNILSVTAEHNGIEKTIEKEFEVFKGKSSGSGITEVGVGGCAHVSPVKIATWETGPQGLWFSSNGMKMFVTGYNGDDVNEFTLTAPYCIATKSFVSAFELSAQEIGAPTDLAFNPWGDKMYVLQASNSEIYEYKLSTRWTVSSASYVDSFDLLTEDSQPRGLEFTPTGDRMFILGSGGDEINQYDLSVRWDVSTASASCHPCFEVDSQDNELEGLAFNTTGDKMFIQGYGNDKVYEYVLSVRWDVSTASFVDSFDYHCVPGGACNIEGGGRDVWFDPTGKTMFLIGDAGDDINVYKLSVAWDVSTASHVS